MSQMITQTEANDKTFHQLIDTMLQQGDVTLMTTETAGRPQRAYQMTEQAWVNHGGETMSESEKS